MVHGSYVALRSIMFGRTCLLPNIEALYINSPVPPCDCKRKCIATTPLLSYISFYKNICKKERNQRIFDFYCMILVHSNTF